jgi:hypothetical protein
MIASQKQQRTGIQYTVALLLSRSDCLFVSLQQCNPSRIGQRNVGQTEITIKLTATDLARQSQAVRNAGRQILLTLDVF